MILIVSGNQATIIPAKNYTVYQNSTLNITYSCRGSSELIWSVACVNPECIALLIATEELKGGVLGIVVEDLSATESVLTITEEARRKIGDLKLSCLSSQGFFSIQTAEYFVYTYGK